MNVSRPQDHAAEFDRLYRQAKRDSKTMSLTERITAIAYSAICFVAGGMIIRATMGDWHAFSASFQGLVACVALFFGCAGIFLAYVAITMPSPPKEPA